VAVTTASYTHALWVPDRKEGSARCISFSLMRCALFAAIGLNTQSGTVLSQSAVLVSKVGQGRHSPKDDICFRWIHHVVSSPNACVLETCFLLTASFRGMLLTPYGVV